MQRNFRWRVNQGEKQEFRSQARLWERYFRWSQGLIAAVMLNVEIVNSNTYNGWMARFLILAILIVIFIILVRAVFPKSNEEQDSTDSMDMVKDPNCNIYVPKSEAVHESIQGKDHYFCGNKCAEEFKQKKA